ncbi:fatty acid hydroxylase domain-containing protein 2-like [Bolinopsis microptera]|uniref:fatty acid hydroxylase domain-containing protein 2-like n=1 Tax=Bolinopsis microptera TaxID=2820187 RepID=UPI0030797D00
MEYCRIKLIWDTNVAGILILLCSALFQVWLSFCDKTSVTWQMMDSLKDAAEQIWRMIWKDLFNENSFLIQTVGTTIWGVLCWLSLNYFFLVVDYTGRPQWLYKYKIQEEKNNPADREKVLDTFKTALYNISVLNFLFITVMYYPNTRWLGSLRSTGLLPTFGELVLQIWAFKIIEELGNYYGHRILHMPRFYKYHKKHHEWTAPMSIVSSHTGTVEHILGSILPAAAGPYIFRSHLFVVWIWSLLVLFNTTVEHSGYHLPFLYSAEGHDYHHKTLTSWYGTMAFLDVLHGTDKPFSGTVDGKRHFISCTLTPVKKTVRENSRRVE